MGFYFFPKHYLIHVALCARLPGPGPGPDRSRSRCQNNHSGFRFREAHRLRLSQR
jgi:hypothetical protein